MHELSITENILEIAVRHGNQANATRITDLYLVIGQLSSVIDDSVQFYWDMISKDTIAEGAHLHFRRIPTKLLCLQCKGEYEPTEADLACPTCGSHKIQVIAGDEFFMEAIEIEDL
jgi:hydrogenase nickel incorporation protein HypA/HybF